MSNIIKGMLAAILTCGTTTAVTSCTDIADNPVPTEPVSESVNKKDYRRQLRQDIGRQVC